MGWNKRRVVERRGEAFDGAVDIGVRAGGWMLDDRCSFVDRTRRLGVVGCGLL